MKGVVITTHDSTEPFFSSLMSSLKGCKYPIVVWKNTDSDNGFEISGIRLGSKLFDEFLYLQDTTFIKDINLIENILETEGSVSIFQRYNSYLGKYETKILNHLIIPEVKNKQQAIRYEVDFITEYLKQVEKYTELFPQLNVWGLPDRVEMKFGRQNAIYETKEFVKYKGTWK